MLYLLMVPLTIGWRPNLSSSCSRLLHSILTSNVIYCQGTAEYSWSLLFLCGWQDPSNFLSCKKDPVLNDKKKAYRRHSNNVYKTWALIKCFFRSSQATSKCVWHCVNFMFLFVKISLDSVWVLFQYYSDLQ